MRIACALVGVVACATTQTAGDTEVFVIDMVTQHCPIPELEAYFRFASVHLEAKTARALDALSRCLIDGPLNQAKIELVGYSDPTGSNRANERLSLRRAEEVARHLAGRGVPEARIVVKAGGELRDQKGARYARRVDIRLIDCAIDPNAKC
jgi:outer membrane protein OmpA-like peptidoglycan-associated protein